MNQAEFQKYVMQRRKFAFAVMYEPHKFKVCDQCLGVAYRERKVCEYCGAYSWDVSIEKIFEIAQHIRRTPLPVSMPYAPRM